MPNKFLRSMNDLSTDDIIHLLIFTEDQMKKAVDLFKDKKMQGVIRWYGLGDIPNVLPEGFRQINENEKIEYTVHAEFNGNSIDFTKLK